MIRHLQALMLGLALLACGSPPPPAAAPPPEPPPEPESELQMEPEHDGPPPDGHMPVRAGAYRLRMTAPCPQQQERTAKGRLTLKRISASELPGGSGAEAEGEERSQRLLWGQTDLDVESLEACLGPRPGAAKREPIHPNLLVEVLQWNGQSQRQVLLVAAEPKKVKGRRSAGGGGVAMWVEQSAEGHLSGVWSRWELGNQGEGRWEAELERGEPQ
jgi:hypothetical protein